MQNQIMPADPAIKLIDEILAELKKNKLSEMSELSDYHLMKNIMLLLARLKDRISQLENSKDEKAKKIFLENRELINDFEKESQKFERNFYLLKTKIEAADDKTKLSGENKNMELYIQLQKDFFDALVKERYGLQRINIKIKNMERKEPDYDKMML
jgi:hypothetical protein